MPSPFILVNVLSLRRMACAVVACGATAAALGLAAPHAFADPWTTDSLPFFTSTSDSGSGVDLNPSPVIGDKYIQIDSPTVGSYLFFKTLGSSSKDWFVGYSTAPNTPAVGVVKYVISIDPGKVVDNPPICEGITSPCAPYFDEIFFALEGEGMATQEVFDQSNSLLAVIKSGETKSVLQHRAQRLNIVLSYSTPVQDPDNFTPFKLGSTYTQAPGPLPALGAGMAYVFSRKLRSRIRAGRSH